MELRKFFSAIWSDWAARMSGPLTVPFAIGAFFVPSGYRILFATLAVVAALITCFRVWEKEYDRAEAEKEAGIAVERRLLDEEPKIIFGLLSSSIDWTMLDTTGEYVFTLTNYGKRPATFIRIEPLKSVAGNFTIYFEGEDILRPDGHYRSIRHAIDDGHTRRELDKRQLWEFLHNCPIERNTQVFDVVIRYRDMEMDKYIIRKMRFDFNSNKLEVLPE